MYMSAQKCRLFTQFSWNFIALVERVIVQVKMEVLGNRGSYKMLALETLEL